MQLATMIDLVARPGVVTPCQADNDDLWFAERPAEVEAAKALCVECPVQAACLAGALERREPWGVWGGELFEAGKVIPRKVPRGRPRKDDPRYVAAASRDRDAA
ncbi:MAG: WhiB family transcriptional regulator [Actinomycetales bacterium]